MPTFTSPSDGVSLHYRIYTPNTAPKPLTLVFLHGWPMSARMWEHLMPTFVLTNHFRCIAPDRRGFGRSDWATKDSGVISWDVFVGDLAGLLEEFGVQEFVFVASSMGCTESLLAYQRSEFIQKRCKVCFPLFPFYDLHYFPQPDTSRRVGNKAHDAKGE